MRCCFDSVTAQLYIKHVRETGLGFNMFGLDQWIEHLLSSGIQMINLSVWALSLLVPSSRCLWLMQQYVCSAQHPMWLPLDKMCQIIIVSRRDRFIIIQYVPREHFFLSYVTVCIAFRIITTCSYDIAALNSCGWKNHFLGSDRNSPPAISSCCWKLIWDFPAPSQNNKFMN